MWPQSVEQQWAGPYDVCVQISGLIHRAKLSRVDVEAFF